MSKVPCAIVVAGRLDDYKFHMAKAIAEDLARNFEQVTVQHYGLLEVDWLDYLGSKLSELSAGADPRGISHRTSPLVFYNTVNYIGGEQDLITWAQRAYKYNASEAFVNKEGYQELNTVLFRRLAKKEYAAWLQSQKSQFVFMDYVQGGKPLGRVVFELFASVLPQTSQNFVELCTGANGLSAHGTSLTYEGSKIHRAVRDTWIQGGDIVGGAGDAGESARGGLLPDENFSVKHDKAGVLAMANSGPHSSHSQFYITLLPMPWLDTRNVAFGRVIQGMRTVNLISKTRTMNQRPLEDVVVAKCGLFVGGEDGGALAAARKRPVTQKALLKQVFSDATGGDPRQTCRHSELLLALAHEASTLRSKFSGQADVVVAAVERDAVESHSETITLDQFVKVSMTALAAQRGGGKSTPQRKLDEALAVDAVINANDAAAATAEKAGGNQVGTEELEEAKPEQAPSMPAVDAGDSDGGDGAAAAGGSEAKEAAAVAEEVVAEAASQEAGRSISSSSNNNDVDEAEQAAAGGAEGK